ncbi:MAG: hypothetical protein EX271_08385 [Acidimicrobiales bacterium]|nr:hypothetical protein [Hyphomonadaceae bacterium]RZV41263.1 MAG: hypothetical protein EX271_08385 [Acidimicrobiales bacterium]
MSDDKKKTPDNRPKTTSGEKPVKSAKSGTSGYKTAPSPTPAKNDRKNAESASKAKNTKTGIGRSSAVLMSVLAALAGGAIGWGGPLLFGGQAAKNEAIQASLNQTRSELATAQAEQKKLAESLSAIQGTSRNQASSSQSIAASLATLEGEVSKLRETQVEGTNVAIASLEDRVSKLGTLTIPTGEGEDGSETTSVDLLTLVDRIESLETEGSNEIATRLGTLETQIAELTAKPTAFPAPDTTPIELPPVETEESAEEILQVLIDTFPRATMLESVAAQKALAAEKPSWLQRVLSRHVKTHDEERSDPVDIINAAEAALQRGDVTKSLDLISELNPPVRAVAADWIDAAKKAAKRIEKDL